MRVTHKNVLRISAASLLAGIGCLALAQPSYAVSTGTFNDNNGTTWAYEYDTDGDDPILTIGFKAVSDPTNTVLNIPSIYEVKDKLSSLSSISSINTYYIKQLVANNAAGVVAPNVTKVDMTNASKVQMVSLAPLFKNTDGEVELQFGNNMVIGDPSDVASYAPYYSGYNVYSGQAGLFEGLSVKLLDLDKVKYIGWRAFKDTTLSASSRDITINENQTVGAYVFAGSNIESLTIDSESIGQGFCLNCQRLTSLSLGDEVDVIYGNAFQSTTALTQVLDTNKVREIGRYAFEYSAITGLTVHNDLQLLKENVFMNTNLGTLDFTGTDVELGNEAFKNAGLTSVNFGQTLSTIRNAVFAGNNIKEVSLPKSLRNIGVGVFTKNPLDTMTINFDIAALNGGSPSPARIMFSGQAVNTGHSSWRDDSMLSLKHLILNAPYGEDEQALPHSQRYGSDYMTTLTNNAKNIIPSNYFMGMDDLASIEIGEGYEIIESQAFMRGKSNYLASGSGFTPFADYYSDFYYASTTVSFPSTLKGIGDRAFMWFSDNRNTVFGELSENLEWVGNQAFYLTAGTIKDVKSHKINYIGDRAFAAGINVEKLYLGDALNTVGFDAFAGNHGYMDLTIDTDIFNGKLRDSSGGTNGSFRSSFGTWIAGKYIDTPLYNLPDGFDGSSANSTSWNYLHHYKSIVFTEKAVTAPSGQTNSFLEGMYCDYIDMSATPWKEIEAVAMQFIKTKELKLPSTLETIGYNAMVGAKIEEELVLPNTLTTIRANAFMSQANGTKMGDVKVTKLPQSLVTIEANAFYRQDRVKLDINLPNLTTLGYGSFLGTRVRDIVFNSRLTEIGANAVYDVPTLRNITIDANLYANASDFNDFYYTYGVFSWAFNTNTENSKQGRFGTIKLTANAGIPCGGFGNCQALADSHLNYNNDPDPIVCKDNDNNTIDCDRKMAYFYGVKARRVDLSELQGMTTVPVAMFQDSEISEVILPDTVKTIGEDAFFNAKIGRINLPDSIETIEDEAFQWTTANVYGYVLPAGVKTVGRSAFYGSDLTDDLYIPATIESIGKDAFNAGGNDVHYDTVSIEGDIDATITNDQLVHQMFWGSDIHTLIIHSSTLPVTHDNGDSDRQQFWNMPMEEVVITALPAIPDNAFEANSNLKLLVMRRDDALRSIGEEAFIDCENLHDVKFSSALANETVTLGKNAFNNTGFVTIGDEDAQFELNAAKFDANAGYVFTNMQKLTNVHIPDNFNNGIVPEGTFANAAELKEVTVAPNVDTIKNAAFANDNKLERIILWGDTIIEDSSLSGYTAPTRSAVTSISGPTVPASTNIYAYTGAKAEAYASARSGEGKFYPLDEVVYITTDKYRITQPTSEDFDGDVTVYALRRDGIVMESDKWGEFDGNTYPRANKDLYFMNEAATVEADPAFGTIFETPISVDNLDFSNQNFSNISYAVADADEDGNRYTTVSYTNGGTNNVATTSVLLRAPAKTRAATTQAVGGMGSSEDTSSAAASSSASNRSVASSNTSSNSSNTSSAASAPASANNTSANTGSTSTSSASASASNAQTSSQSSSASTQTTGGRGASETPATTSAANAGSSSEDDDTDAEPAVVASNDDEDDADDADDANEADDEDDADDADDADDEVAETTGVVATETTSKASGTVNPKTGDTILGYIALFASCSLLGGAAIAIIRHNKR